MLVPLSVLLGVASRLEEQVIGGTVVSTNFVWLATAFVAGRSGGALAGGAALTAANGGYYAWCAVSEPWVAPASIAGAPAHWFALGAFAGGVLGALGASRGASATALALAIGVTAQADLLRWMTP